MTVAWSKWASLGRPAETEIGRPFAQHNLDGRLEVFALGRGAIFNISQVVPNGGWRDGWRSKDRPSPQIGLRAHIVGTNADGRQEIFAVGDDRSLWQKWQLAPNDGWSEWSSLGSPPGSVAVTDQFTLGRNQDGRQEVFAVGSDGNLWQIWQTAPNGGWSGWEQSKKLPKGIRHADRITVARNKDGRQELFAMGGDDALWHMRQVAPNVGWTDWGSLGKPRDSGFSDPPHARDLSEPVVQPNADGHLEVFSPGNGAFCNRWQEVPNGTVWRHEGWNEKPKPQPTVGITWLEAARNFTGELRDHLEVFAFGDDGAFWHAWQIDQAPNWSHWESLGSPPLGLRTADRLTIGTNQDGRLEAFTIGADGAVWHIWQIP
jgi:hypothetical protein